MNLVGFGAGALISEVEWVPSEEAGRLKSRCRLLGDSTRDDRLEYGLLADVTPLFALDLDDCEYESSELCVNLA